MSRAVAVRQTRAWVALVVLLLAGCGTERPEPTTSLAAEAASEAGASGFVEQQRILADGHVTAEEYRTAVDQEIGCLRRGGLSVSAPILSPVDGLQFLVESTSNGQSVPDHNRAVGECGLRHVSYVEKVYLATHRPMMDRQLSIRTVTCLRGRGIAIQSDATGSPELFAQAGPTARSAVIECIANEAKALHPEMSTVVIPESG